MRRRSGLVLTVSLLAGLMPLASSINAHALCGYPVPDGVCQQVPQPPAVPPNPLPPPPADIPYDPNVIVAQSSYAPATVDVRFGRKVIFQNFDLVDHTVVYNSPGCLDSNPATFCLFYKGLPIGARGPSALALPISNGFTIGKTYEFICVIHPTMKGSLTVH